MSVKGHRVEGPRHGLRELVEQATPGPWRFVPESDEYIVFAPRDFEASHAAGHGETPENTRLIALAPELAVLLAAAKDALYGWRAGHLQLAFDVAGGPCICEKCERTLALLARIEELEGKA